MFTRTIKPTLNRLLDRNPAVVLSGPRQAGETTLARELARERDAVYVDLERPIFEATKLPLTVWFQGIYFMTQGKKGCSAMTLHRQLGISYNAAWRMRHKLMQVMMERDAEHPLGGIVELDDAYLGGERSGGKRGRGAPGKTPFVAAVETNDEGHPLRVADSCALDGDSWNT